MIIPSHIETLQNPCAYKPVHSNDIFNLSFLASADSRISPYVVLLCNNFRATIKGNKLCVVGDHDAITPEWRDYVEKNGETILLDIATIDRFFSNNKGMVV